MGHYYFIQLFLLQDSIEQLIASLECRIGNDLTLNINLHNRGNSLTIQCRPLRNALAIRIAILHEVDIGMHEGLLDLLVFGCPFIDEVGCKVTHGIFDIG